MARAIESFFDAWSQGKAADLTDCVTQDVYYADPNTSPITGVAAVIDYVSGFAGNMPGGGARVIAQSEHDGHLRATVEFTKDGAAMMRGQYFADLDARGHLTRIVGFEGMGEPV